MMPVSTDNAPVASKWGSPVRVAAIYTLVLRVVYGVYGAALSGHLDINPRLMNSNALTDHLISRSDRFLYAILGVWERFDTVWYVHIAQNGYDRPPAIVFYPLFPLLIRLGTWVLHPPILVALVISSVASFFFFWGIQQLLELDSPRITALLTVYVAGMWPASVILLAGYAEALVLAFSVWSLYFARKSRWPMAGLIGILAGASKAVGCFVAVPLL